ncbi:MAG: hypothetical protein MJ192_11370 [Clostridia bacterium]|nr:hypothetical protein [Clostridia bacterium]
MSAEAINPTGAPVVGGKYLMFKDRPLVRQDDTIVYGDMTEKYILILDIMNYVKENGVDVPGDVFINVVESQDQNKVFRQGQKKGLYEAFGYGLIWLDQALNK